MEPEETPLEEEPVKVKRVRKLKAEIGDGEQVAVPDLTATKLSELTKACTVALAFYKSRHTLKTPDDYDYPGFKEMWQIINS